MSHPADEISGSNRYWVVPHVYLCVSHQQVVLLNVLADRYLSLSAQAAAGLHAVIEGWPLPEQLGCRSHSDIAPKLKVLTELIARGLLVSDAASGKPATPVAAMSPRRAAGTDYLTEPLAASRQDIANALKAFTVACYMKRYWHLSHIIARVRTRNVVHSDMPYEALRFTALFERLRPLLYPANDACLFDSLVLGEFLARYGIFPRWMFGVQANPFAAHCWLQVGDIALNDREEQSQGLSIILAI